MAMLDRLRGVVDTALERVRTPYLERRVIPVEALGPRQSQAGRLADWQTTTPHYPPANWRSLRLRGYRGNPPFFRCVDMLARNICQADLEIVDRVTRKPIEGHPLVELLRRGGRAPARGTVGGPQPGLTESSLWTEFVVDAYTTGNAIWEKIRARGSREVVELWRLDPARVAIEPDARIGIRRYLYQVGGKWWPIPRENIIHWRFPDPLQPYFGIPPIFAASRDLAVDSDLTDHFKVVLQNHAVPAVALEHEEPISEPQAEEARRRWRKLYGGGRRGGVAVTGGGTKVKVVGLDMKQMEIGSLVAVPESRIAMVHGVPIILLGRSGTQSDPTRANYQEAKTHFWTDTILPLLDQLAEQITLFLLPEFGDASRLEASWNCNAVPVLQEAKLKRAEKAASVYESGMISRHQAQALAGVPRHGLDTFHGDITEQTQE